MQGFGSIDRRRIHERLIGRTGRGMVVDGRTLALRPASAVSPAGPSEPNAVTVGGIPTARMTREALAETMVRDCRAAADGSLTAPRVVVSSNGSVIARYHRDRAFRAAIAQADIVDADGMPLVIASRWFCREPLPERVATTDLVHDCCAQAAAHGLKFYFLGGRPGVAARAAERLQARHPGLDIVGVRDGYFPTAVEPEICRRIREAGTDVLWVGLGSPRQERFAIENRDRLHGLGWVRTCGGLFDHMTGDVRRAPSWMQRAGLEWAFRTMREPLRLTVRYATTNPPAIYHLLTKTGERVPVFSSE